MKNIKFSFRIYDPFQEKMVYSGRTPMMIHSFFKYTAVLNTMYGMEYMLYTGLKKGDIDIYEGDILDWEGLILPITIENKHSFKFKFGQDELAKFHIVEGELIGNEYEMIDNGRDQRR